MLQETYQFVHDMTDRRRPGYSCLDQLEVQSSWLSTLRDIERGLVPERRPASEFDVEPLDSCETWDMIESQYPRIVTASGAVIVSGFAESFERDLEEIWAL